MGQLLFRRRHALGASIQHLEIVNASEHLLNEHAKNGFRMTGGEMMCRDVRRAMRYERAPDVRETDPGDGGLPLCRVCAEGLDGFAEADAIEL